MNELQVLGVLQAGILGLIGFVWSDLRKYREAYAAAKGTNLATREDIEEITRKIETVKDAAALGARQREKTALIVKFVDLYKRTPSNAPEGEKRKVELAYYELLLWVPSEMLEALTRMLKDGDHEKPDVKDLIILARRWILKGDAGPFKGGDLVNLVGQAAPLPGVGR